MLTLKIVIAIPNRNRANPTASAAYGTPRDLPVEPTKCNGSCRIAAVPSAKVPNQSSCDGSKQMSIPRYTRADTR